METTVNEFRDLKFQSEDGGCGMMFARATMIKSESGEYVMLSLPHSYDDHEHPALLEEFYKDEAPYKRNKYGTWSIYVIPADRITMDYRREENGIINIILDGIYLIMTGAKHNFYVEDDCTNVSGLDEEFTYTSFDRYPAYDKLVRTIPDAVIEMNPVVVKCYGIYDDDDDNIEMANDIKTYLFNGFEIQSNNSVVCDDSIYNVVTFIHSKYTK